MKIHSLFLAAGILLTSLTFAQTPKPCPEFANMVSHYKESTNALSDLESPEATAKQAKKGLYGGFNNSIRLAKGTSTVKVSSKQGSALCVSDR